MTNILRIVHYLELLNVCFGLLLLPQYKNSSRATVSGRSMLVPITLGDDERWEANGPFSGGSHLRSYRSTV